MTTPMPTDARIAGVIATTGLAASAALHLVWLRSPWPLADWPAWSRAFGGASFRVPDTIMLAVALLFAAAAWIVGVRARLLPRVGPAWPYSVATWTIAVVLVARAIVGFVEMPMTLANPATPPAFRDTIRLYLAIYLPVFLVLGAASAWVAARTPR
jgi:hypothetical protein